MLKVGELPIRTNLTPNDLMAKEYLLRNQYRFWITFIVIDFLANLLSRIFLDSVISYVKYILLIIIIFFIMEKYAKWFNRYLTSGDSEMDDINIVYLMLNIKHFIIITLVTLIVGTAGLIVNFILYF
jgi:hypothetical protein